jgi:hypothetical protein
VYRLVAATDLVGNDAKKMKAIEVVLIDGENFSIVCFGFRQFAGRMVPARHNQQIGNLRANARCAGRHSGASVPAEFGRHSSLFPVHREEPNLESAGAAH